MITDAVAEELVGFPLADARSCSKNGSSIPLISKPIYGYVRILITEYNQRKTSLVLQVIPPIWPRLLDASLFFHDRTLYHTAKDAESHRNSMVIVAVNYDIALQLVHRFPIDL